MAGLYDMSFYKLHRISIVFIGLVLTSDDPIILQIPSNCTIGFGEAFILFVL